MKKIKLQDLLVAVNGELCGDMKDTSREIHDIATDSRKVKELDVFFSLVGERFDAHDFLPEIKNAVGFVISKKLTRYDPNKFYVLVKDTQKALGDLAKWYRNLFEIPFIAVTGSVGKTTAKDMVASVLSAKYAVHKTQGNFNNTIGLPLTLLQLEEKHEICVLEMGMDTAGEIDYMAKIVQPDVAIITNIGDAHIERLGSREGIRSAKMELVPHIQKDGLLLLNGDDPMLSEVVKSIPITVKTIGERNELNYQAREFETDGITFCQFMVQSEDLSCKVNVPALGKHMIYPTLFAAALGKYYSLTEEQIQKGVAAFLPTKMRMNVLPFEEGFTFLDDSYNANPQSMEAAVKILAGYSGKEKVAVLGDMLELGDVAVSSHKKIGEIVVAEKIDVLVTVGQLSSEMAKVVGNSCDLYSFSNYNEAIEQVKSFLKPDTTILFKASRGMALDLLISELSNYVKEQRLTK